ncbi:HepT-like ribonuclease domain-containing protein [Desulfuromonas thiophila]|uniref:HepT-like ribonuclease domain-containing protein n=1 Tax=Desulfuromonas thiophila TaxID=57664 RepID=UPI003D12E6FA
MQKKSEMPWHQICAMRNILAHEYLGVDVVLVWGAVQKQLSDLKKVLQVSVA